VSTEETQPGVRSRGQATVELVFVLPVVVLLALVVVQVAVVARSSVLLAHAAREGARAAAVEPDPRAAEAAAHNAAVAASTLQPSRVHVDVVVGERDVVVTVRYDDPTDVAMVGRLVGPVRLQERATMRREDP
jgi:Flp pilus assembly protein TadG